MDNGESVTIEQPLLGVGPEEIASVTVGVGPAEAADATTTVTLTVTPRNPEEAVARSAGEKLAAVGAALRSGETTFTNRHEAALTPEAVAVAPRREDDSTTLVATLRTAAEPPETTHEVPFENRGDAFVRPDASGPPRPSGDGSPGGGVLGSVKERLFATRSGRDVTIEDDRIRYETDWPDEQTVRADVRVADNALLVHVLGETIAGDDRSRSEVSRTVEPPFPITADGATAERAAGTLSVTVPRCAPGERDDGELEIEETD